MPSIDRATAGMLVVDLERGRVTLLPPTELDLAADGWWRSALTQVEELSATEVVIDMRDVSFVAVQSTALLAAAAKRLRAAGRRVRVASPPPGLRLVAVTCGLVDVLGLSTA